MPNQHTVPGALGPIAIQFRDRIIEQVSEGAYVKDVARQLGIARQNISKQLAKDPEYVQARIDGCEQRIDQALQAIEEMAGLGVTEDGQIVGLTQEQGTLARVRNEVLKARQWQAEREFPERWGGKQTVTVNQGLTMDQALGSMAEQILDKMRVVATQLPQSTTEITEED